MAKSFLSNAAKYILASALVPLASVAFAAPFASGNIVVVRVGSGSSALAANQADAVFLDEYTTAGALVQSVAMPTTVAGSNLRLTLGGLNTAEGSLALSTDGRFLTLGGYDADPGTTGIVAGASTRVIGRVDPTGAVDTSTAVTDGFTGGRIASVTSNDGTQFWSGGSGTGGGTRFSASLGATTTIPVTDTPNNVRWVKIFAGQLYTSVSFNTGGFLGVSSIGAGTPIVSGQTLTVLPGLPTSGTHSHFGYFFSDANTLFIADDGTAVNGGGLQKWTFDGTTWTQAGAPFPYISATTNPGFRGLTGSVTNSGANVTLYLTTTEATGNALVKWSSADGGATGTFTTLATAPTTTNGTVFRGVAFAPAEPVEPAAVGNWMNW